MKLLKIVGLIVMLVGTWYLAEGIWSVYLASLNATELPLRVAQKIAATDTTWNEWKRSFLQGGIYAVMLGVLTLIVGAGIATRRAWGRTFWIFLTPILLLTQFVQGQISLNYFKSTYISQQAVILLVVVALSWLLLLLPSSRREMDINTEPRRRH